MTHKRACPQETHSGKGQGGVQRIHPIQVKKLPMDLGARALGLAKDVKDTAALGVVNRDVSTRNVREFLSSMPQGAGCFFIVQHSAAPLFFASFDDGLVGRHISRQTVGLQQCHNLAAIQRW